MTKQDGYIIDTPYPAFIYKEMQPLWLNTLINFLGFKSIDLTHKFSYLELACATGLNLCLTAFHYPDAEFVGIDFNLEHIKQANAHAKTLGLKNIRFIHCDFNTFLKDNHKHFDYIVCHGTYSWVSKTQQQNILEICARFLNPLGILYLHYMCHPGSNALQPIQKLFSLVDQVNDHDPLTNVQHAKTLFDHLEHLGAFVDDPKIDAIKKSLEHDPQYLAHEFLTEHWQPLYSVDVHQNVFKATHMSFLGSANPCDNLDNISIPRKLQPLIKNTQNLAVKEYLKDLARNSKQRIDIFQKNSEILESSQHISTLKNMKFKLISRLPKHSDIQFNTAIGTIMASQETISPLIKLLEEKEQNFSALLNLSPFKNNPIFLIETIFLMMNAQYLHPVRPVSLPINPLKLERFNSLIAQHSHNYKIIPECASAF